MLCAAWPQRELPDLMAGQLSLFMVQMTPEKTLLLIEHLTR
jgi:hypothetical protein